jgi:hypothetical protein
MELGSNSEDKVGNTSTASTFRERNKPHRGTPSGTVKVTGHTRKDILGGIASRFVVAFWALRIRKLEITVSSIQHGVIASES